MNREIIGEDSFQERDAKFNRMTNELYDRVGDRDNYYVIPANFDFANVPEAYANSIWEIRYEHDLGGEIITLPSNVTLDFKGGNIINGGIYNDLTNDFAGKYESGLSGLAVVKNFVPSFNKIVLDMRNLPAILSKYNLVCDGVFDNSANLNALMGENIIRRWSMFSEICFIFTNDYSSRTTSSYRFTDVIRIDQDAMYEFIFMTDVKFDKSGVTLPDLAAVSGTVDLAGFRFIGLKGLKIRGIPNDRYGKRVLLDGGLDTVIGDWYEGVEVNGTEYYSTIYAPVVSILRCDKVDVNNISVRNGHDGIIVSDFGHVNIKDVEAYNINGDNGVTVTKPKNSIYSRDVSQYEISDIYCHECSDLGLSVQAKNGFIKNVLVENCGNNNINNINTFGVSNSFNAGGGISVELLSGYDESDKVNANIKFDNISIKNCYNYGVFCDCGGVQFNKVDIDGVISTLPTDWETLTGFKYRAVSIRKGVAFYLGSVFNQDNTVINNSIIKNIPYFSHLTCNENIIEFNNCKFDNVAGNSTYDFSNETKIKISGGVINNSSIPLYNETYINVPNIEYTTLPTHYAASDKGLIILYNGLPAFWDGSMFKDFLGNILI